MHYGQGRLFRVSQIDISPVPSVMACHVAWCKCPGGPQGQPTLRFAVLKRVFDAINKKILLLFFKKEELSFLAFVAPVCLMRHLPCRRVASHRLCPIMGLQPWGPNNAIL
jgi:hypothetical protein